MKRFKVIFIKLFKMETGADTELHVGDITMDKQPKVIEKADGNSLCELMGSNPIVSNFKEVYF